MDGEIGVEWIKHFEKATRAKAKGEYRLLIIDGHNSHYTVAFLQVAREHKIIVICYPVHGTHLYQGLDVVVFVVLKLHLSQEHDKWFCTTGQPINKNNFLRILSEAYVFALTPENIKTAFHKTDIVPFNPSVITADMLTTSKETSTEAHFPMTNKTASESIQIIADMLHSLQLNIGNDGDVSSTPYHLEAAEILVPEPVAQVPASSPRPT